MKIKTKRGARRIRNQRVIDRSKCYDWRTATPNQIFEDIYETFHRSDAITHVNIKFDEPSDIKYLYDLAK